MSADLDPKGQAWNPRSFLPLFALFGIGALVALSINWARLARGNRTLPSLFIGLVLVGGIFAGPILHNLDELASTPAIALSIGFGITFLAYLVGLMIVQARDYQDYLKYPQFRKQGKVSYAGTWAIIAGTLFMVALLGGVTIYAIITNKPETIQTQYFNITRPGTWESGSTTQSEFCNDYRQGCLVYFETYGETDDVMFAITYLPTNGLDFETAVARRWRDIKAVESNFELGRTREKHVDGRLVEFQDYVSQARYVDGALNSYDNYISVGYVALDGGLLEITYWAIGSEDFRENQSDFDDMLDSIEFTDNLDQPSA